jgi:hypothetical protein
MNLGSPLPVNGLASGSSVRVTENRRLLGPPPGLSSRNTHQARRDLNGRGLSETFNVTSVMPLHAGVSLKASDICASKFLSSTAGSAVQAETPWPDEDWQSASAFFSLHCSSRMRMEFSRLLQPQSDSSPNNRVVIAFFRMVCIVGVHMNHRAASSRTQRTLRASASREKGFCRTVADWLVASISNADCSE